MGPFFFEEQTINGANYLDMLQNFLVNEMEGAADDWWFQQDGAPAHWSRAVRNFLDVWRRDRWIGRGGPISWPPRSPDITPCDFFFWGFIKDRVYSERIRDVDHLRERIINACNEVTPEMLRNTWRELRLRLQTLQENGGHHVELG